MRTYIGPKIKKSSKKKNDQNVEQPKRKLFGGVKGGRKKADPNAAKRAAELRELRKFDWLDNPDEEDDTGTEDNVSVSADDSDDPVYLVDAKECSDEELNQIIRDFENNDPTVDTDTVNVLSQAKNFLNETKTVAEVASKSTKKGRKPTKSRIPAEVAKNLSAFHFFHEADSDKKDAEFDIDAIVSRFKDHHKWFVDTEAKFSSSMGRFFDDWRNVASLLTFFGLTIEEFMKLFVGKYVDLITKELVKTHIVPCVAKLAKKHLTQIEARSWLLGKST